MMKIYFTKMNNVPQISTFDLTNLKLIGIYTYIYTLDNNKPMDINIILERFKLQLSDLRSLLASLEKKDLIMMKLTEDEFVNIEVTLLDNIAPKSQNDADDIVSLIVNTFGLGIEQITDIVRVSQDKYQNINEEKLKCSLFTLVKKVNLPTSNRSFAINTEEDFIDFLDEVYPHQLIEKSNSKLNKQQFEFIFNCIYNYSFKKSLINFVIDYTINNNEYEIFNVNYGTKVAINWKRNKIENVSQAIEYIKSSKIRMEKKKNDSVYVEPTWDNAEGVQGAIMSQEELDILLTKAYE